MTYEEAMRFVISIRPRMAVIDAHDAALRLLRMANSEPLEDVVKREDWPQVARLSPSVMEWVRAGKKIQAIKELRTLTDIGLKEAKDAIEHPSVWDAEAPS